MTADTETFMGTNAASGRFAVLPDDETLAQTRSGLDRRGISVEVVDGLDEARDAVLARIPEGSAVVTFPSVTLQETGIAPHITDGQDDPAGHAVMADSLSLALLVLLESLSPYRTRRHVEQRRPHFQPTRAQRERLPARFFAAS